TGFFFPNDHLTPGQIVGIISLVVLAVAIAARYWKHMTGIWRLVYVLAVTIAQYLNFAVLVIQSFQKIPALAALAPTQSEAPFAATQLVVLVLFVILGRMAAIKFRPASPAV